jgi:hypothetical protein
MMSCSTLFSFLLVHDGVGSRIIISNRVSVSGYPFAYIVVTVS